MMIDYISLVEGVIESTIIQFFEKPHLFFNEHEFHNYCYHRFYLKKSFNKLYTTKDGKRTNILHPEYPTIARFNRKRIEIDPHGRRAKYDIAILNPEFIENNTFEKVQNRNYKLLTKEERQNPGYHLLAALEFKFINKHADKYIHELKYDQFKLTSGKEVGEKYMLVFSNTNVEEIDYLQYIKLDDQIKLIYIEVTKPSRRKKDGVKFENPDKWLTRDW